MRLTDEEEGQLAVRIMDLLVLSFIKEGRSIAPRPVTLVEERQWAQQLEVDVEKVRSFFAARTLSIQDTPDGWRIPQSVYRQLETELDAL